jgi:hypothetical protein
MSYPPGLLSEEAAPMNKWMCLLACLLVSLTHAQTTPRVVFTGDDFTLAWQQTTESTANQNWIGAGVSVQCCLGPGSSLVEEDFQANVINQHPAFVHILTGGSDISNKEHYDNKQRIRRGPLTLDR